MLNLLIALFWMFIAAFIIMAVFMGVFLRQEIKQAYKEWKIEKYGIDFHDKS